MAHVKNLHKIRVENGLQTIVCNPFSYFIWLSYEIETLWYCAYFLLRLMFRTGKGELQMEQAQVYGFSMIHMDKIAEVMRREKALLVDLRSEESYRGGHMNQARNFPYSNIGQWSRELPDKVSLILYCEHGNLSLMAARKLKGRKGAVYTVIGGYQAYRKWNGGQQKGLT